MANNVTLPGTGQVVASKDIGGGVEAQEIILLEKDTNTAINPATSDNQTNGNQKVQNTVLDVVATGSITTIEQTVQVAIQGRNSVSATLSGIWTGAFVIEGSGDNGVTWSGLWFAKVLEDPTFGGISQTEYTDTINGLYKVFNTTGLTHVRVRASATMTGSMSVTLYAVAAVPNFMFTNSAIVQRVYADAKNSSIVNVAAGASFVGLANSSLGVASLQYMFKSDKACKVYIDQSGGMRTGAGTVTTNGTANLVGSGTNFLSYAVGDEIFVQGESSRIIATIGSDTTLTVTQAFTTSVGARTWQAYDWDLTYEYDFNPLKGGIGGSPNALGAYYRIRVTNIEAAITTFFRLAAALCPVSTPLPNTVDEEGALQVCVKGLHDEFGNEGKYTPSQEALVTSALKIVGTDFAASNNSRFYTLASSGGTASATENVIITLTSGTSTSAYAQATTVAVGRFVPGESNFVRCLIRTPTVLVANNTRRWGAFTVSGQTPQNGFYFELSAGGVLSVVCCKGGTSTPIVSGDFNGLVNLFNVDTSVHLYDIVYLKAAVQFYVDKTLVHTFTPTTAPLTNTLHLPITATSINSSIGTVSGVLECWTLTMSRYGVAEAASKYINIHGIVSASVLKIGPGRLRRIVWNTYVAGSTVSIYDAVTATNPIASCVPAVAGSGTVTMPVSVPYECEFQTGLCITTVNASTDITVVYD